MFTLYHYDFSTYPKRTSNDKKLGVYESLDAARKAQWLKGGTIENYIVDEKGNIVG